MECFKILSNEIEGRIDPFYYRPEFIELEKKIAQKTNRKLGDYIISISGGATPSRKKDNELYCDERNGIPFLRVQNITEEGLVLDDVKFITKSVHETQLKRSQVKEDNLLITITGRIASSCVVPKDFEGNINQHSVVVKTKNRKTSEIIARFLNLNVGHKLALRRTSGGSRPALDHLALKSIPIIFDEKIVSLMDKAYFQKKQKESEAQKLLDSINDYVLDELGIKFPKLENKMTYVVSSEEMKNTRCDALYFQPKFEEIEKAIKKGKFEIKKIGEILEYYKKGIEVGSNSYVNEGIPFIRVSDIDNYKIKYEKTDKKIEIELYEELKNYRPKKDELLFSKDGSVGFCVVVNEDKDSIISGGILRLKVKKEINNFYIKSILSSNFFKILTERESIGSIIKHLTPEVFLSLHIPLPPFNIQNKIAEEVKKRMQKAEQLQKEAKEDLEKAKQEVEKIILDKI